MAEDRGSNILILAAVGLGAYYLYRKFSAPPLGEPVPSSGGGGGSPPATGTPSGSGPGPVTGGGTAPRTGQGTAPGGGVTTPGSGSRPATPSGTPPGGGSQSVEQRIRQMAQQHGKTAYNVHEWNYFLASVSGEQGPAPEDLGVSHTDQLTFDQWWKRYQSWRSVSRMSLPERILYRARAWSGQQDPKLTADEWNWFFTAESGRAAPAAEDYGFIGERRTAKVSFSEWWSAMTSHGYGVSGFGRLYRWPFVRRSPWEV